MYRPGRLTVGPSKASATTLCQKCLQKGHYSYECTVPAQSRPYNSRPSRTQQLLDPKLVPKLNSDTTNPLLRKDGVADEQLANIAKARGRLSEGQGRGRSAQRSPSLASSSSISTISTNLSRSPSPRRSNFPHRDTKRTKPRPHRKSSMDSHRSVTGLYSSSRSTDGSTRQRMSPGKIRSIPAATTERVPPRDMTAERSRSPPSDTHPQDGGRVRDRSPIVASRDVQQSSRQRPRVRSPSPFSKRLALTQAMNI